MCAVICLAGESYLCFQYAERQCPIVFLKSMTEIVCGFVKTLFFQLECDVYGRIYITSRCAHLLFLARGCCSDVNLKVELQVTLQCKTLLEWNTGQRTLNVQ